MSICSVTLTCTISFPLCMGSWSRGGLVPMVNRWTGGSISNFKEVNIYNGGRDEYEYSSIGGFFFLSFSFFSFLLFKMMCVRYWMEIKQVAKEFSENGIKCPQC